VNVRYFCRNTFFEPECSATKTSAIRPCPATRSGEPARILRQKSPAQHYRKTQHVHTVCARVRLLVGMFFWRPTDRFWGYVFTLRQNSIIIWVLSQCIITTTLNSFDKRPIRNVHPVCPAAAVVKRVTDCTPNTPTYVRG